MFVCLCWSHKRTVCRLDWRPLRNQRGRMRQCALPKRGDLQRPSRWLRVFVRIWMGGFGLRYGHRRVFVCALFERRDVCGCGRWVFVHVRRRYHFSRLGLSVPTAFDLRCSQPCLLSFYILYVERCVSYCSIGLRFDHTVFVVSLFVFKVGLESTAEARLTSAPACLA